MSCVVIALQGKRSAIKAYLQEIQESVEAVADGGILDHMLARLLPVVVALRAHQPPSLEGSAEKPASFDVTSKFAPAQKNEKQLMFKKMKPKTNRTKFPLK